MRELKRGHPDALVLTSTDTLSGRTQVDPGTTTVLGACLHSVPPPAQFAVLMLPPHLQVSGLPPSASSTRSRGTSACCKAPRSLLQLQTWPEPASSAQPRLFDPDSPPVATLNSRMNTLHIANVLGYRSPDRAIPASPHSAACPAPRTPRLRR